MENAANWRTESRTVYSSDFKLRMVELASRPDANVAQPVSYTHLTLPTM